MDTTASSASEIAKLTKMFEDARLFLCCNILTSFEALEVLAYITALKLGNYRELESDCLEFTKAAAKLASKKFVTERELAKSKVKLEVRMKENVDDLTITSFKSEAFSRVNPSSRYLALVSIVSMQSWLLTPFFISLLVVTFYHFFFR